MKPIPRVVLLKALRAETKESLWSKVKRFLLGL